MIDQEHRSQVARRRPKFLKIGHLYPAQVCWVQADVAQAALPEHACRSIHGTRRRDKILPIRGAGTGEIAREYRGVAFAEPSHAAELGRFHVPVAAIDSREVRLRIYAGQQLVYDDLHRLPGPVSLTLPK